MVVGRRESGVIRRPNWQNLYACGPLCASFREAAAGSLLVKYGLPGLHLQLVVVEGFPETPKSSICLVGMLFFFFFLAPGNISMTPNILTTS